MTKVAVIIPFRDRGRDPLRPANLERILEHWQDYGHPVIIAADGRQHDDQFNRSAAYNHGTTQTDADILIYAESDMLISHRQIDQAIDAAATQPGLVIPFTEYHYLTPQASRQVLTGQTQPQNAATQYIKAGGRSIGAINILSRHTLNLTGQWDEQFSGSWYDDNAMHRAFTICAGPTRWITGPAYHLYHLPAHKGPHLTQADRQATQANRARWDMYRQATTPNEIRALTGAT
ncbi:hypothetical protein [Mycobacterium marinum]|uniref:hypothetical protein n=1 Tax=Mycobacterium marinum TaxID=1781 RepID=UPI000B979ABC|nr:hypothetical protein [Mycobacterium marinum]